MGTTLQGINLGYMRLDWEFLCFPHPSRILHAGNQKSEHVYYNCPTLCYIIDHPDGRILWETGISSEWPTEWPAAWQGVADLEQVTPDVCLENSLKRRGYGPEDFRYLVMGHLHCDHAGGMRMFQEAGTEILVHEDEWAHVRTLESEGTLQDYYYSPADLEMLKAKAPVLVPGDTEIADGVTLISVPGHTPGTMALQLELEHTGTVLLTSDALTYHESYGPPEIGSPHTWDTVAHRRSSARIRQIALEKEAYLFPGHDETGIRQYKTKSEFVKIRFDAGHRYE
jgi:glyoxylase-like metal-dependent hydrolase (beta-lactamase superfamily II)